MRWDEEAVLAWTTTVPDGNGVAITVPMVSVFYITEVGITEAGTPVARRRAGIAVGARDRQPVDTHGGKRERTR